MAERDAEFVAPAVPLAESQYVPLPPDAPARYVIRDGQVWDTVADGPAVGSLDPLTDACRALNNYEHAFRLLYHRHSPHVVPESDYKRFERAVLSLATAICPEEHHCQACLNRASVALQESAREMGQ